MATYYVKNGGNDSKDGLSDANAWATIAKVNSISSTLPAGTVVQFRCGDIWREQLSPAVSGSIDSITRFSYYGDLALGLPKICGSDLKTSWTNTSGNIWQTAATTRPYIVIFNGSHMGVAQANTGALIADYDFYWSANVLYVYATSDPALYYTSIEAGARTYGFTYSSRSYLQFDNLHVYGTNGTGCAGNTSSTQITIRDNVFNMIGGGQSTSDAAINLTGPSCYAYNNTIDSIVGHGIYIVHNSSIAERNTISNCYDGGQYPSAKGNGVYILGTSLASRSNNSVRCNWIQGCYQGIVLQYGSENIVYGNFILDSLVNGITQSTRTDSEKNYYYNNIIIHNPTNALVGHGLSTQGGASGGGMVAKNNLVIGNCAVVGTFGNLVEITSSSFGDMNWDYNQYYNAPNSTLMFGKLESTDCNTFAEWQTALSATSFAGKDANASTGSAIFRGYSAGSFGAGVLRRK